jgi:hypothetical protein
MKRNKELYATAMAALCMQYDMPSKHGWWFTKPSQDPPDGVIGTPIEDVSRGGQAMHVREIEIVEHLNGSVIDTIQNKLVRKSYEPNTALVCLLTGRDPITVVDYKAVSEEMSRLKLPLAHVFLVGHGFKITQSFTSSSEQDQIASMLQILFIQLLPMFAVVNISPNTVCESFRAGKEKAWLRFDKLGMGTGFQEVTAEVPKLFD